MSSVKIGIEIHQQLSTGKLFCRCPSLLRNDLPEITVRRKLRPSAGELGKIDPAAIHEFGLDRSFVYEGYGDTTCLVELDEEPPHKINLEAVGVALQVAQALGAKPVDETQIMRKTIIDGSCVSGFQRTALVAVDGELELEGGKRIGIPTICIEEDAARLMSPSAAGEAVYRLDRAGIPLIEIATTPDIRSPEEAREAAEKIGMLLRCTGRVMRGIGTIRQDLNVSIDGGARTEIKGVQWLSLIPLFVENEIKRQESLRGIFKSGIKIGRKKDAARVFKNTKCKIIADKLANGGVVLALILHGSAGLFKRELHPGKRFGKEVAEYAKARSGVGGFFHTDELPAYGITAEEVEALRKNLGASAADLVALVCGKPDLAEKAIAAIVERLSAKQGAEETRRANEDGSTSYMRPLPGAGRLYPETDVPPLPLGSVGDVPKIETVEEKLSRLEKLGLNTELAKSVFLSERADVFDRAVALGVPPTLAATTLEQTIPYLRRKGAKVDELSDEKMVAVFELFSRNRITKEILPDVLEKLCAGAKLEELAAATKMADPKEVDEVISKLVAEKKDYVKAQKERAVGGLMGLAMERLKGRADGKAISAILKKKVAGALS